MFEVSLLPILQNDSVIAEFVSVYNSQAAVFSDAAPEDADLPYATTTIQEGAAVGDSIVSSFLVTIEIYNHDESGRDARRFCDRVIKLLDGHQIDGDARYHKIRLFIANGPVRIDEGDPRDVHYQVQFSARAGRKSFIESYAANTTEGD